MTLTQWLALVGVLYSSLLLAAEDRCGSDGPSPLVDKTDVHAKITLVPTTGELQEFTRWEAKDAFVYRTSENKLFETAINVTPKALPDLNGWLSRIVDPFNRYVVSERPARVLRVGNEKWTAPPGVPYDAEPLFWKDDSLFLVKIVNGAHPRFYFYQYFYHHATTHLVCSYPGEQGRYYRIGKGHEYPNAVFFDVRQSAMGYFLTGVSIDAPRCAGEFTNFVDPFVAPVYNITAMKRPDATLIELPPSVNRIAYWPKDLPCHYYDTKGSKIFSLGNDKSSVATFSAKEGLHVLDLMTGERHRIMRNVPMRELSQNTIALDKDGRALYLAPKLEGKAESALFKLMMD